MTDTEPVDSLLITPAQIESKLCEAENNEDLKDSFNELDNYLDREDKDYNKRKVGAWLISFATHAFIGLLFSIIVFTQMNNEDKWEYPPIQTQTVIDQPPVVKQEKLPIKLEKEDVVKIENPDPRADDKPIIPNIEIAQVDTEIELPKGELDNVSVSELGGKGFNFAIGVGAGGGGIYGNRFGGNKRKAAISGYGPRARGAESVINNGLRWLVKHQGAQGEWQAVDYYKNCDADNKCEPGQGNKGDTTIALTAYSCLSFLANGYDHSSPNTFRNVVAKGLDYIISQQKADGSFGERMYEHAIATQCISEALAMSNDSRLREPATKAVKFLLMQSANSGSNTIGWDYTSPNPSRIDYSITGWGLFALKAAHSAGIDVKGSMGGMKYSIENSWKLANPNYKNLDSYTGKSVFPYVWNSVKSVTEKDHLSFVAATSLSFLGHKPGDIMLDTLLNDMNARFLDNDEYKNNAYALYYASLATFNTQTKFKEWSEKFVPYLIDIQYKTSDCHGGTFDYPNQKFHGWDTSRVLIHNYYLLALSVVYRYKITLH